MRAAAAVALIKLCSPLENNNKSQHNAHCQKGAKAELQSWARQGRACKLS